MMISEIPTRFRAFQKDEQSESPPQTGWSERVRVCREHERQWLRPRVLPRPARAVRGCRAALPARAQAPAFLWNGLLDDYNSSPSVNQYFVDYGGRSAHVGPLAVAQAMPATPTAYAA